MKNTFRGFYKPNDSEFQALWKNCIFIVDTNVILDIYRLSDATKKELLKLLSSLSERLWLPHQVGLEYHRKRLNVITEQVYNYDSSIDEFETFVKKMKSKFEENRHPYVNDPQKYLNKLSSITKEITSELNNKKQKYSRLLKNDNNLKEITKLFEGRVGPSYSDERLEELYKEGEKRYNNKVPPGFKNKDKSSNKYGDFIIWRQVIDKAKSDNISVILITSENKEDWWLMHNNKTIGPRAELINEFFSKTNQQFYLYRTPNFLKSANDYLKSNLKQEMIDEVKRVTEFSDLDNMKVQIERSRYSDKLATSLGYDSTVLKNMKNFAKISRVYDTTELARMAKNAIPDLEHLKAMRNEIAHSIDIGNINLQTEHLQQIIKDNENQLKYIKEYFNQIDRDKTDEKETKK